MRSAPPGAPWRAALSLFTVIPVAGPAEMRRETAARAILWLPVLGGLLGAAAAGALLAVEAGGHSGPRRLLAATIAVAVLGVLTGALLVVLLQVAALATVAPGRPEAVALVAAAVTGRVAVILAAGSPAARPGGFGALIAGSATTQARATAVVALLLVVGAGGAAAGGAVLAVRSLAADVLAQGPGSTPQNRESG